MREWQRLCVRVGQQGIDLSLCSSSISACSSDPRLRPTAATRGQAGCWRELVCDGQGVQPVGNEVEASVGRR